MGLHRAVVLVCWIGALLFAQQAARAAEVGYSAIDLATVRIFALEGVGVFDAQHKKTKRRYTLAEPLAAHGSGLLISADGLILTARHVVEQARQLAVIVPGEESPVMARVLYVDDRQDFAFISIGGTHKAFAELPAKPPSLRVRQPVFAVGYPLDPSKKRPQSTKGVISGTDDSGGYTLGISVNPGNSGGPLLSESEDILGVIVARGDPERGIQGVGVAVALDRPLSVLKQVAERHARTRASLDSLPEGERAFARVIGGLVEGAGVWQMISDAQLALTHLKRSAFSGQMTRALGMPDADPDLLVLGCAYHWNSAVVHRVLDQAGWQKEMKAAERYCGQAAKADPDVVSRSPIVKVVNSTESAYRLGSAQSGGEPQTSPSLVAPSTGAPAGAAGFSFGSSVEDVVKVCKGAKLSLTGVKKEGLRCSGTPVSMGFPAVVRLRFCEDALCRIDVIQKLSGDDASEWLGQHEQRLKELGASFGQASRSIHRMSPDCTESIAWCLSNQKVRLEDDWLWRTEGAGIILRMDRADRRGILKLSFERR